ncbi:stage III sporulation protein AF [Paenibacillus sp. GCM10023252]|uniref:stage III sporulation protein AF n=1 Tax=Paenibacillus sp. GCM10023252 TaxID=3252649 RepID=UPI003606053F
MLGWLSEWLRDIIAVILLAVFVELLLPNKAMQRYARLVVGLFILLTIMSPILRLLQGDLDTKLQEGIELWDKNEVTRDIRMPSLDDIQKSAEELKGRQSRAAAELTEQKVEGAMLQELNSRAAGRVSTVEVELGWEEQQGGTAAYIAAVVVTLDAESAAAADTSSQDEVNVEPVEPVEPVSIDEAVSMDQDEGEQTPAAQPAWAPAQEEQALEIKRVLMEGWSVSPGRVQVRQAAAPS